MNASPQKISSCGTGGMRSKIRFRTASMLGARKPPNAMKHRAPARRESDFRMSALCKRATCKTLDIVSPYMYRHPVVTPRRWGRVFNEYIYENFLHNIEAQIQSWLRASADHVPDGTWTYSRDKAEG